MVRGITRQVVVVKGPDPKVFDQAIFLVRDDVLAQGGVTEEVLLRQAREACNQKRAGVPLLQKLLWAAGGAGTMGLLWLLTALL